MAKKERAQAPRRWTPNQAQAVIGRLLVPAILLALLAVYLQTPWVLLPAFALWVVMALILFKYWRCPKCGLEADTAWPCWYFDPEAKLGVALVPGIDSSNAGEALH